MAKRELLASIPVELEDGRRARVLSYNDGSVRFKLSGGPYVITEAFMTGPDEFILRVSPGTNGDAAVVD